MRKTLIIKGHQPYPFSLNDRLFEGTRSWLDDQGHEVRVSRIAEGYDVEEAIAAHQWTDVVIMQFPINEKMVPWSFEKYIDDVYTAGMDGRF